MSYKKKVVVVGITGCIAAYKAANIVSYLKQRGFDVKVIMTKNACEFITPKTLEVLSNNQVVVDMFERKDKYDVEHISIAKEADAFLVAPATANFLAKVNAGIADDMLSTTFMGSKAIKFIAPAMNTNMYDDVATQNNIASLKARGIEIIEPPFGNLACGDVGKGRLEVPEVIAEKVIDKLRVKRDLEGKTVLITVGGTVEDIDGVRYMSNYSSGKMGSALIDAALSRGALVTAIVGNVSVDISCAAKIIKVKSTEDMYDACLNNYSECDIIIKAAAPCDFRIKNKYDNKIKDKNLLLEFVPNKDIAKALGAVKGERKLVVFAAETQNLIDNAKEKLKNKNADMIIANDLTLDGAGFCSDTNIVNIIDKNGNIEKIEKMEKCCIADIILDRVIKLV